MGRRNSYYQTKRKNKIGLFLITSALIVVIVIMTMPYLKHINAFRQGLADYDFAILKQELAWFEEKGPWLKKLPLIHEGELWLMLNQGQYETIESELVQTDKDSYRFWLLQLYLAQGKGDKAEELLSSFNDQNYRKLAEGLFWADREDYTKASGSLLGLSDNDLGSEEQILKNILLARNYLAQGNYEQAQKVWELAFKVSAKHPLVLETEYDLALASGQWGRAKELAQVISSELDTPYQEQLLVKRALLALVTGDRDGYESVLQALHEREMGESCIQYLMGIEKYERGQFSLAVTYWEKAMELGVPDFLMKDVIQALDQAKERVEAEKSLKAITG